MASPASAALRYRKWLTNNLARRMYLDLVDKGATAEDIQKTYRDHTKGQFNFGVWRLVHRFYLRYGSN